MRGARAIGRQLEAYVDGAQMKRTPLDGEGVEAAAWPMYQTALKRLSPDFDEQWKALLGARSGQSGAAARELRDALVAANQDSLTALKSGAHCLDAKAPMDWQAGQPEVPIHLQESRNLAILAGLAAEVELAGGRPGAAVDALLDAAQFGADLMRVPCARGEMVGHAVLNATLQNTLVERGLFLQLPPLELERLAVALRALDAQLLAPWFSFEARMARFVRSVEKTHEATGLFDRELKPKFLGYDSTTASEVAELLEEELALEQEFEDVRDLAWPEAEARFASVLARESQLGRVLWGHRRSEVERSRRFILANLRLVLAAVELRAGRAAQLLPDPFGDELVAIENADGVRLESVGPDAGRLPTLTVFVPRD